MRRAPLSDRLRPRIHDPLRFESVYCDCGEEFAREKAVPIIACPTCKLVLDFSEEMKGPA